MAKTLKILGIIILTIIVLIGLGITLLIHFVDPNKFKSEIDAAVYHNTGRHLTINGNLAWTFFPWIGFKVTNAELDNAPGFGKQPLAKIGEADISIRLLPLLTGHVEIHNVELNGLQINLIRNENGAVNWKINKQQTNSTNTTNNTKHSPETINKANTALNFSISNLTVVNSSITWNDQLNKIAYSFNNLYIAGHNVGTQKLFPLTVSFNLNSKKFSKPIAVSFSANFNIGKYLASIGINQIDVTINDFEMGGDLSAKNLQGPITFQGDLHIPMFNLRNLLKAFNIILPNFNNSKALEKLSTDLAFNGGDNKLSIKPFKLTVDDTTVNGEINFSNLKQRKINYKLTANNIDIDDYFPRKLKTTPLSKTNTTNAVDANAGNQKITLPINLLRHLNLQGSFAINQFVVANLHLSDVQTQLKAQNGMIKLAPVTANLYEGALTTNATLNVESAIPQYQLTTTIKAVQAQSLINDLLHKNFIAGTANFSTMLNSNGNTVQSLIRNLNGSGHFNFKNGQINGINVEYELARAKALLDKKTIPNKPKSNSTPFGNITGSYNINNGLINNNDLQITNQHFVGKGAGELNLVQSSLNYKLNILPKDDDLKEYRIPIKITGALTTPSVQLDMDDILKQVLEKQKKRLIEQQKQRLQQEVKKHIKHKDLQNAVGKLLGQ